jgi:gliding motility-associated-like protein
MKKIAIITTLLLLVLVSLNYLKDNSVEDLREKHKAFLEASPVKESLKLSKKQRKSNGLPPNKYFEREWELTLNPATGEPEPKKVLLLQQKLSKQNRLNKTPGDAVANPWIERGPNNVGGRTRTLLFDPNDATNKRVFAGGVGGGLWVNNDITNENSQWVQITNVPGNMSVSCIAVDPNNTNVFYIGTGELYTGGAVTGNGVYKSIDGGTSWVSVFGGAQAVTSGGLSQKTVSGHYYVQDVIVRNNNGTSEVFIGVGANYWRYSGDLTTYLGRPTDYGVYKSIDGGTNWTLPTIPSIDGKRQQPNDFEISADNTLWLTTTRNYFGDKGGTILKSTDGSTFTEVRKIPNVNRTEISFSSTNASKAYVLAAGTDEKPVIYKTENAFSTAPTVVSLPNDSDTGIDADDFTRGQSYYDLMLEIDPSNDEIVYVGGINLFRSSNSGETWSQISRWHAGKPGNYSVVHADQHAMTFNPGNSDQAIFGNDGGVYFASSLASAPTSKTVISKRNDNYNVTQFYRGAIAPTVANEFFLGGTQDNGSPFFENPGGNINSSIDISGGDGAYCFVDQSSSSYMIVSYVYNNSYNLYNFEINEWRTINNDDARDGDFINQADLDSNLDIMYANGSNDSGNQIYKYSNLKSIEKEGVALKHTLKNSLLSSFPTAMRVSPYTTTSSTLLVGTQNGTLLKVTNANATASWSDITGNQFLGSISDIEFGKNEDEIFVTFHNYGVANIWFTEDGGLNWESKEGDLPDLPVKAILQNPLERNEVIVGTDLGMWKTENFNENSPSWEQTYNGMSDVKVTDLQLRAEDNTVLATTYGRGVFTGKFDYSLPRFEISSTMVEKTISKGSSEIVFEIDYEVFLGFNESVSFSLSGVPSSVVTTINPISPIDLNATGSFTVTLSNITNTNAIGTFQLLLTGTSATVTKTLDLRLITDTDNDGVSNLTDNCVFLANADQKDTNNDGEGDICDDDDDGDGIIDVNDNSQFIVNPDQKDTDNDGEGDVSDTDDDNDNILDGDDNCPLTANSEQRDFDGDNVGDICDTDIDISKDIPKGFSPNNDGINDFWLIEKIGEIYPENKLQIFNKSGQLVYEKTPYDNSFEGIGNVGGSSKLPIGAYVYQLVTGDPVADFYPVGYVKKGWIYIKY